LLSIGLLVLGNTAFADFLPRLPNDPMFVRLSRRCSFYLIPADSHRWIVLGLGDAPVQETSPMTRGNGLDVVAVPFGPDGKVAFAPAYIFNLQPENYRVRKMRGLVQGYTRKQDVEQLLGEAQSKRRRGQYEVWYYQFPVQNLSDEQMFEGPDAD
jgi:hypothetical protein